MRFSRYDPSYGSYSEWHGIASGGTWKKISPDALSGILPASTLLNKANSVLVMASASANVSVFVANINRVDKASSALDQEPYIAVFDHSASAASGGFVHHGDWPRRTTLPGKQFFDGISASGIQAYYPWTEMPTTSSGNLDELKVASQNVALWVSLLALRDSSQ